MGLLHKLAADCGFAVSPPAAEALAARLPESVRDLQGAVNKLAALRQVAGGSPGGAIGLVLVEQVFNDTSWRPKTPLRMGEVLKAVCTRLRVDRAELLGSGRHRRVVVARGLTAYLSRQLTTLSYPEIARALGRKHHSTVHTAVGRITRRLHFSRRRAGQSSQLEISLSSN